MLHQDKYITHLRDADDNHNMVIGLLIGVQGVVILYNQLLIHNKVVQLNLPQNMFWSVPFWSWEEKMNYSQKFSSGSQRLMHM
jgi:hypothetical protein